tara:strand:+ start:540 stop:1922 length:1383 start_codon:yes stop_codon:yes gene_type:complete
MRLEQQILANLIENEDYVRQSIAHLRASYFLDAEYREVFKVVRDYVTAYNSPPSVSAIKIALQDNRKITEDLYSKCEDLINSLKSDNPDEKWLIDQTEKFCKDKAVYNAIMQSIQIIDGQDKTHTVDALPSILSDALSVGFDNNIGHDYVADAEARFEFYHRHEEKLPFDLEYFNKITEGGLINKTLNIALAGTGVGKSLFMCHVGASMISQGKNVLYITLEMAEERIAERIDANMMDVSMQDLRDLSKSMYTDRVKKIKDKVDGRLIVKEYPTATAHAGHFRALLEELKLKQNFYPDIIFIDYLNICVSQRLRNNSGANSYTIVKSIAEELRGLAVEYDLPIVSATQTTRGGFNNSDVDLTDTSESFGLPATADLMFALISTEELEQQGHMMVKQLKNRYSDPTRNKRFMIGVDRAKMRLFDLDENAQNLVDSGQVQDEQPVFDRGNFGSRLNLSDIKV